VGWPQGLAERGHSCGLVLVPANVAGGGVGGLGGQLAANGRDVSEPSLAGALVEPELDGQLGDCQQGELLGSGLLSLTLRHSCIIAKGCDTVVG
jgi:hypothetical protein